jgi:hypothetical protein
MHSLNDNLMSIGELLHSPIWAMGASPSKRTIYDWSVLLGMPRHKRGRLTWYNEREIYEFLCTGFFRCPRGRRAEFLSIAKAGDAPLLVTLEQLRIAGIWTTDSAPSERTLRTWVAADTIPYYRISHSLYFHVNAVRHCFTKQVQSEGLAA